MHKHHCVQCAIDKACSTIDRSIEEVGGDRGGRRRIEEVIGLFHDRSTNALHPITFDSAAGLSNRFSWALKSILTVAGP